MKNYKVLVIPSSDDERIIEELDITFYDDIEAYALKNISSAKVHKFSTEREKEVFIEGYLAGVGYLGEGVYFTND
jgi:hypothetical protein